MKQRRPQPRKGEEEREDESVGTTWGAEGEEGHLPGDEVSLRLPKTHHVVE